MKKSYIISQYKVSKTTYQFVHDKLYGLSHEEKRFFLHVLCSQLIDLGKGHDVLLGWDTLGLNLPSKTIRAEFDRGVSWDKMAPKMQGLLEASDYAKRQCRYFQVVPPLFEEIRSHLQDQLDHPDGSPAVNLFDGTAYCVGYAMPYPPEPEFPSSKLMRDAVRVLQTASCPFNIEAVQAHLERLKTSNDPAYQNDQLCAQTLFAGMKQQANVGYYTPSYAPLRTGRIAEVGGGLQSCTKEMKEAAFRRIENVYNYDLRSAHGYVLLQELKLAGIDGQWVEEHLGPGTFEARADALRLPKKVYKKCFFATVNGASHYWSDDDPGAIQAELLKHLKSVDVAKQKFGQVVAQLKPLKKIVDEWRKWLLSPTCPHRVKTQRRDYILNASGQRIFRSHEEFEQKVIAHILQGREAAYIHHLTLISNDYDFVPISNQHDGLITMGNVPDEAKIAARKLSGFEQPFLEIKSFV